MNLVGEVGETDETHEFLANHWRRGGVCGRDEGGIRWAGIAILRESIAVAAGIVRHLSEGAWTKRWTTGNARETERLGSSLVVARFGDSSEQVVCVCLYLVAETTLGRFLIILRNT